MKIRYQLIHDTNMRFPGVNPKRFLTVHETSNYSVGANAAAHANLQSRNYQGAAWHWSVDATEAVQSYSHDFRLWHAGDGQGHGNMSSIGQEICVNADMSVAQARDNGARLSAHILKLEGLPISSMVQHNHWSGKNCPLIMRNEGHWPAYVEAVRRYMGSAPAPAPTPSGLIYTVLRNESLSVIGDKLGINWATIARFNNIVSPYVIYTGQQLRLPGGSTPAPAPTPAKKSADQVARDILNAPNYGGWGTNPERATKLRSAGYDPSAVQSIVNKLISGQGSTPALHPVSKTVDQVARDILNAPNYGGWGTNPERATKLRNAGYDPSAVQGRINQLIANGGSASPAKKSVDAIAREIINLPNYGGWSTGADRMNRLRNAGYDPSAVQNRINALLR